MKKKIILAYSGGLDTTTIIAWLKENQECDVIALCIDLGQAADWKAITKRALAAGASACHIADVKKEFVEQFIWPALKAGVVYEDKYLPGAAIARPLIAKALVEFARKEKAAAVAHGASCNGNGQVRYDLGILALAPDLEIIAPWRVWKLKTKQDEVRYLSRRKIPVPAKKKNSYTTKDNLWQVSHEGLDLEDPGNEPLYKKILSITASPEKAPNKAVYAEIEFEKGIPVALNGKKLEGPALIKELNKIGGTNGIGITDLVENTILGLKNRSIYETPGGTILYYTHRELERLCLDRQTYAFKQQVSFKLSELIYRGMWFTPLREALCAFIDSTQQTVSGKIKVKLYKGSISSAGVTSPNSLFNAGFAGSAAGELYSNSDAKGFVKLYGLPILARSIAESEKKGGKKPAASASGKAPAKGKEKPAKPKAAAAKAKSAAGKGKAGKK